MQLNTALETMEMETAETRCVLPTRFAPSSLQMCNIH
jgi:hypothetical protein